jgi:hypothetical protein
MGSNSDTSSNSWILPPPLQPGVWVQLLLRPNPFSFDQALLLCEASDHEWLAWIPDYGEMMLDTDIFCRLS